MQTKIFTIYDKKSQLHSISFAFQQKGPAIRAFNDMVTDQRNVINKHPEDYSLYTIGELNDQTGALTPIQPEFIAEALDFIPTNK